MAMVKRLQLLKKINNSLTTEQKYHQKLEYVARRRSGQRELSKALSLEIFHYQEIKIICAWTYYDFHNTGKLENQDLKY